MQLIHTKTCELTQSHIYDSLTLQFIKIETFFQVLLSLSRSLTCTDDMNNFVNIITCNNQSFKNMSTFLSLSQVILCSADCYVVTMLYEILHAFTQAKQTWTSLNKSDTVYRE